MSPPYPCPHCGGTIRDRYETSVASGPMTGEWVLGACDGCTAGSFALAERPRPRSRRRPDLPARARVSQRPRDGSDLRWLRSIPSAVYVPLLTGRDVVRGMVRCPLHADGEERTASLHVQDGDGGWRCHACGQGGGIFEFYCHLTGRVLPAGGREFARLIDEVADALRRVA